MARLPAHRAAALNAHGKVISDAHGKRGAQKGRTLECTQAPVESHKEGFRRWNWPVQ